VLSSLRVGAGAAVLPLPGGVQWIGVGVMIAGLAVRVWAALVLGAAYTRTLRVTERQGLVRAGPYRLVRHPGYAGAVVLWLGAALASGDALAALIIVPTTVWAYALRISAEERMLADAFGSEFRDYVRTTWRLVPFVF
jgi:protein-S-isoprenylcysteine O-methyltransferase